MKQSFGVTDRRSRHDHGWGGRSGLHVPLLSEGEWHQGFFRVPEDFGGDEHTNVQHRATQYRDQKVKEWVEFKARSGYRLLGKPFVTDPILGPTASPGSEALDDEGARVYVRAKFVRTTPMKMPLDLFLHKQEEAARYQIDLEQSLVENPLPTTVDHVPAGEALDPSDAAIERRDQLGIRRELIWDDDTVTGAEVIYETPPGPDEVESLDRDQGSN